MEKIEYNMHRTKAVGPIVQTLDGEYGKRIRRNCWMFSSGLHRKQRF